MERHTKRWSRLSLGLAQKRMWKVLSIRGELISMRSKPSSQVAPPHALDLGAGGGHVSYLMAPYAGTVTAADLFSEMVAAVARTARDKGLDNIETVEASAEELPFEAGNFDFLACRHSAHHWRDFDGGLREARRVLKRGAPAVFIDAYSPGPLYSDTHIQAVELLRDTSHVRDYTASEWIAALQRSGFALQACQTWRLRMDFPVWTTRMGTPEPNARAIRALQVAASAEVSTPFAIEGDGSFTLYILMIETTTN